MEQGEVGRFMNPYPDDFTKDPGYRCFVIVIPEVSGETVSAADCGDGTREVNFYTTREEPQSEINEHPDQLGDFVVEECIVRKDGTIHTEQGHTFTPEMLEIDDILPPNPQNIKASFDEAAMEI
jgi:hypothetical protein